MAISWHEILELVNNNLSPVLETLDFKLVENQIDDNQAKLRYECTLDHLQSHLEVDCSPLSDMHDNNRREFLWLRVQITWVKHRRISKFFLAMLLAKMNIRRSVWVFKELSELDDILNHIVQIANDKLLNWVKNPISPSKPTLRVNPNQRLQALQIRMSTLQDDLDVAIEKDDTDRIRLLKSHLENLEAMVEKTLREMEE